MQSILVVIRNAFVTTKNFTNYGHITQYTEPSNLDYSSDFQSNGNINVTNQYFTIFALFVEMVILPITQPLH